MSKIIAPEGEPGDGLDDDVRCRWAAEHDRYRPDRADFKPTAAEGARIARGRELLANSNDDLR